MITSKQGVVAAVFAQALPAPDQWGNNFRRSFKLEGDDAYYGVGTGKRENISVKVGKNFRDLVVGDEITFVAESREYNGKTYWNASTTKITFLSAEGNAPKPASASAPRAAAPAPAPKGTFQGNELSIKSGRAVNAAVLLVTSGHFKGSLEEALSRVIALEQYADANYNELYKAQAEAANFTKKVESAAKVKEQEPPASAADVDDFDDDIPF